ncbi:periplasmic binding protein-like I [Paraphysoderma sedebokerense]|nr:periplasmic binding protein-like I [Paraphysoderma sedebokerense]
MRLSGFFCTALLVLLSVCCTRIAAQIDIKIGVIVPNITDLRFLADGTWHMLQMYADQINNDTNLLPPGSRISISVKSSDHMPSRAVIRALEYAQDEQVFAVLGEMTSRSTIPLALSLNKFRTLVCSGSATNSDLSSKINYPYFFRTLANDNLQAVIIAKYLKFMGWTKVAIVAINDEYGLGLSKTFQEAANNLNVTVVTQQLYLAANPDFVGDMRALKESGARIIVVFGTRDYGPELMIEARKQGLVGKDFVWICSEAFFPAVVSIVEEKSYTAEHMDAVDGMIAAYPLEAGDSALAQNVTANYEARFSSKPAPYGYFFHDCLATIVYGIKNALQKNSSLTLPQLLNRSDSSIDAVNFVSGLQFEGATGTVFFDSNADRVGKFAFMNNQNGTIKTVHTYNPLTDKFESSSVAPQFYNGRTSIPSDTPTFTQLLVSWNDPFVITLLVLHGIMILIVSSTCGILWHSKDTSNVKALSLNFVYLVSVGLIILYGSVFLFVGVPNSAQCVAQVWIPWLGYIIVTSNLAVKVYRIYKIFDNPQMSQRKSLQDKYLLGASSLLIFVEIILLIITTTTDPPTAKRFVDKSLSVEYTVCVQNKPTETVAILLTYNILILFSVLYLAFKTRSVVSRFRESRWIGYTVQNVLITILVLAPIINTTTPGNVNGIFYTRTVFMFYATTVAYGCLAGRLLFILYNDSKLGRASISTSSMKVGMKSSNWGNASGKLAFPDVAENVMECDAVIKISGSFFSTWRSHRITLFKKKQILVIRDQRVAIEQPCEAYAVGGISITPSEEFDNCIVLITSKHNYLIQFLDAESFASWGEALNRIQTSGSIHPTNHSNPTSHSKVSGNQSKVSNS